MINIQSGTEITSRLNVKEQSWFTTEKEFGIGFRWILSRDEAYGTNISNFRQYKVFFHEQNQRRSLNIFIKIQSRWFFRLTYVLWFIGTTEWKSLHQIQWYIQRMLYEIFTKKYYKQPKWQRFFGFLTDKSRLAMLISRNYKFFTFLEFYRYIVLFILWEYLQHQYVYYVRKEFAEYWIWKEKNMRIFIFEKT